MPFHDADHINGKHKSKMKHGCNGISGLKHLISESWINEWKYQKIAQNHDKRRWTQKREQEPTTNCMNIEKVLNFTFRFICGSVSYICLTLIIFAGIFMSCASELSDIRMQETRSSGFVSINQFVGVFLVLPSKCRRIISVRQRPLPSKSLAIHYLSVIIPMAAT